MANSLAQVTIDAMTLSFEEREQLIARLLEEADTPLSDEWIAEIERRVQAIEAGLETIPAEEFFAVMRQRLDEARSFSPRA